MIAERTHPQGGGPATVIGDDRRRAVRLLCRNGNSTTISVPPEFMAAMGIFPGDRVELVFDREWGGFLVRTYFEPVDAPAAAASEREAPHAP